MTFLFLFISIARRDFIPFFASNPGLASVEPTTPRSGATLFFFYKYDISPLFPFYPSKVWNVTRLGSWPLALGLLLYFNLPVCTEGGWQERIPHCDLWMM